MEITSVTQLKNRFRGFIPVVVDVETGGFNEKTDALLQIAAVLLDYDENQQLQPVETITCHVNPFPGANMDPKSMEVNGIDPDHPLRMAIDEHPALSKIFVPIRNVLKKHDCKRAILVGHNATLDLRFINAASERAGIKRNPFHPFSTFDTVSLAGLAYGQTVLARACQVAGLGWDNREAHSAIYDAEMTASLFCQIVNQFPYSPPTES